MPERYPRAYADVLEAVSLAVSRRGILLHTPIPANSDYCAVGANKSCADGYTTFLETKLALKHGVLDAVQVEIRSMRDWHSLDWVRWCEHILAGLDTTVVLGSRQETERWIGGPRQNEFEGEAIASAGAATAAQPPEYPHYSLL